MRSAFLGAEPIPARARELLQDAAAELRRLHDLQLVEPVDYGLALEIELALADAGAPGLEDGALYGHRQGLFRRFLRLLGVR